MRKHKQQRSKSRAALGVAIALATIGAMLLGGGQTTAQAVTPEDAVLDWNLYAVQALINSSTAGTPGVGQPPPVSVLHLAMVQGAVYDAVNSIDGGHEPYLDGLPAAPASANKAAAVAQAAHDVLVGMSITPSLTSAIVTRLDGHLDDYLDAALAVDDAADVAAGVTAGSAAAEAMLIKRQSDGRYTAGMSFTEGTGVGQWRPTSAVNDPNAWIRDVATFAIETQSQFRTAGPRTIGTGAYRREYDEVKDLGGNGVVGQTPTQRTAEQTQLAQFFTANPVEMFNRTFRGLAPAEGLTLVEQARLFALLNLSGADAAIGCWDDKEHWKFWRPITAIRQDDGDPLTVGDANWTSLIASPPYPDHPSGYNCQSGAFMDAAKAVLGDRTDFVLSATINPPVVPATVTMTRPYERFSDVVEDTIDGRIYQGIHFRSGDEDGAWLGRKVARWINEHYLQPVDDD
jgi:hypothetical protein